MDLPPWLYRKPFDNSPGNGLYYTHLYNTLNLLQCLQIPHRGVVLEVGSGPGWLTEILFSLGFEVMALEPAETMIRVAQERISACVDHHRVDDSPRVTFLCESLEECSLADESVDAVIFHEALHHIVDEERGIAQCFRVLRKGGVLGVTGEGSWIPGNRQQEDSLREEMARYGTLENPFTFEYIEYVLRKHGFKQVARYHGINGFFPVQDEGLTIRQAAQWPAEWFNHLTARKPLSEHPTTDDPQATARAKMRLVEVSRDRDKNQVRLKVGLMNSGGVTWLHGSAAGRVTVALFRGGNPGDVGFQEAINRVPLPRSVLPGEKLILDGDFHVPPDASGPWYVGLVCERYYWFHTTGTVPVEVRLA
jgi:SAM-dependent methyltransferase